MKNFTTFKICLYFTNLVFRHTSQKKFDESMARKKGYRLNILGTFLQKILMYFAGSIFCNVYVVICKNNVSKF